MNATDFPTRWQLSTANRIVRAVIGITAILSATMNQGLSEGWEFVLAVFGIYATQTAIFNIELFYAFFTLPGADVITSSEENSSD